MRYQWLIGYLYDNPNSATSELVALASSPNVKLLCFGTTPVGASEASTLTSKIDVTSSVISNSASKSKTAETVCSLVLAYQIKVCLLGRH